MSRICIIRPEFFTSDQIKKCSRNARLLFILMRCFCDDEGYHPACYDRLKAEVFPKDNLSQEEVRELVDELITNGLLGEYELNDKPYWRVMDWEQHIASDDVMSGSDI